MYLKNARQISKLYPFSMMIECVECAHRDFFKIFVVNVIRLWILMTAKSCALCSRKKKYEAATAIATKTTRGTSQRQRMWQLLRDDVR